VKPNNCCLNDGFLANELINAANTIPIPAPAPANPIDGVEFIYKSSPQTVQDSYPSYGFPTY